MKVLSLVLIMSATLLSACGADKQENVADNSTATTVASVNATTADASTTTKELAKSDTGEAIHQANCMSCHDTTVYTREDHKVVSLDGLTKQVQMCDTQLETQLFPEDLDKVVSYLNDSFYKF